MIYNIEDTYISFQKAKARFLSRPYRIPTKWENIWAKMTEANMYNLEMITKAFSTRWHNIDMDKFFDCGFQLFNKSFTYTKFYDKRILRLYVENDKQQKRNETNIKDKMVESFYFISNWMNERKHRDDISIYTQYCRMNEDGIRAPLRHYLKNNIDTHTLAWLMSKKYLVLQDYEKILVPLIVENYWKYSEEAIKAIGVNYECEKS